jgi:hypothetical protein
MHAIWTGGKKGTWVMKDPTIKVAILYPGDYAARRNATPDNNRLAPIFQAFANLNVIAEPAVYHDTFREDVRRQLRHVDAVLVWMNPIQDGRDRTQLDAMLRDAADRGVFVSAHPDIILKMGTKEVLYRTRHMEWGSDTHWYRSMEAMQRELPMRFAAGQARVLKQYRGNGGNGVWKIEAIERTSVMQADALVRVRHAKRGCVEETIAWADFLNRCRPYFSGGGSMIDQAYQSRLPEGMVRCYLVHDRIVGFGHQAINALYPAPSDASPSGAPKPGPRLYHPPDKAAFQALKRKVENAWVPEMQALLGIETVGLPILWDCDFLLGPEDASGRDTYVLCEINVSSVAPFPASAPPHVAAATRARIIDRRCHQK